MSEYLVQFNNISKFFGKVIALKDVTMKLKKGEIPSSLKVNAYNKKIFLKKLASKILPRNFELNKKRGFSIPIATFFENEKWLNTAKDILLEKNSLFNTRSVSNIIKKPFFNHNNSERIFGLLIFELWRKKYNVSL